MIIIVSEKLQKNDNEQISITTVTESTTENTTQNKKASNHNLYDTYNFENCKIILYDDNTYKIFSENNEFFFSGKTKVIKGKKIIEDKIVTKKELKKGGYDIKNINLNNLYCINLAYDLHKFDGATEYYKKEFSDKNNTSFKLFVYINNESEKEYNSAINNAFNSLSLNKQFF